MDVTFFKNQPYFPKNSLQRENWNKENFQDLFQIITPTPFSISKPELAVFEPEPESNEIPTAQNNTLEQLPLNPSITQPISLENMLTISPNQPAISEPSQLQSTAVAEPSQLQSITTIEPVVPTTDYNIRLGGAQQHQQELHVYSWHN